MATACIINEYISYSDRGAFVQKEPWQSWEVDEEQIKAGEPLTKWPSSDKPVVKAYDGEHLELEYKNEAFSIKVGEEVLLHESMMSQNYGVTEYCLTTVKVIATTITYKGSWQSGSTIHQKLEGPIGNGEVQYPNGDHFKGFFHLSYANINGPAHAAEGRYEFADGSYIEKAWIHTSNERKPQRWGLHGVFRVHHPNGPDSIAMFALGKRYGLELFLPEYERSKPKVKEWYANEEVIRWESDQPEKRSLEVVDYELDETNRVDCITLKLTVKDYCQKYSIEQVGGKYTANQYDNYYYEPSTSVTVYLPDGDCIDHYGTSLRAFIPQEGYITMHNTKTGMYRSELWENGKQVLAEEWKRDVRAAKSVSIPDPFGQGKSEAKVWKDGYIEYSCGEWVYEGEVANNRPKGKGVLTGGKYRHEGERYEGEFQDGRCHGQGVYVNEKAGITQNGEWKNGMFQESHAATAPVILHAKYGRKSWSIGSSGEWVWEEKDVEVEIGSLGHYIGGLKIARIEQNRITLTHNDRTELLTPGETVSFYQEVEGREWSDGCVYDGTDYQLFLTWEK